MKYSVGIIATNKTTGIRIIVGSPYPGDEDYYYYSNAENGSEIDGTVHINNIVDAEFIALSDSDSDKDKIKAAAYVSLKHLDSVISDLGKDDLIKTYNEK